MAQGVLFVALLLFSVALAAQQQRPPQASTQGFVRNSYARGRSSSVFLVDESAGVPLGSSVFLQQKKQGLAPSMGDVRFCDYASHRLGIEVENASEMQHLKDSIFRKSRGVFLFALDQVSLDELPSDLELFSLVEPAAVRETSAFQDEVALLTSVVSGSPVSQHAVPARSWFQRDGTRVSAFSSDASQSQAASLADRVVESSRDSLVLSASSDFQLSSALAAHPLLRTSARQAHGVFLDPKSKSFESVYHDEQQSTFFLVDHADIAPLSGLARLFDLTRSDDKQRVSLSVGGKKVHFAPRHPVEYAFLSEMEFLLQLVSGLKNEPELRSLVRDDSPDYYAFACSSLKLLRPAGAQKFASAVRIVDAVLSHAIRELRTLYGPSFMFHGLLLDQRKVRVSTHKLVDTVARTLEGDVVIYGTSLFPRVPESDVCAALNAKLSGARAYCPVDVATAAPALAQVHHAREEIFAAERAVALAESGANNTGGGVIAPGSYNPSTPYLPWSSVVAFHLVFWTCIAIGGSMVFASTAIGSLGIPSSSPLVRQLPNIYQSTSQLREL